MRLNTAQVVDKYVPTVTAAVLPYTPPLYGSLMAPFDSVGAVYVTREQAMSVPAVARARNILCGTVGTLPLKEYNSQDQTITPRKVIDQPDPAVPRSVTITWLAEDLLFYGVGYLQVMDVSPADGRPYKLRRINPNRVSYNLSTDRSLIESYNLDTNKLPNDGLGSLIVFQGWDEGVLKRAGRTIQTAIELEAAAFRMASEPVPQMVLNNEGMNLDGDSVAKLLASFKQARRDRSTAYTEGPIKLQTLGFDSAQMQLVEARSHAASEIARLMGIPAWYLNAESASSTYSNVSAERRSLLDFGARMIISCIEDRLSMDDVTPRGQYVEFDLDDFLRGNPAEQSDIAIKLVTAGIITVDEAREMVDYAPSTAIAPPGGTNESA
jgi:HK97 family phage portal protein